MNKREFKDKVYSELARITKALANPHRLEIIELLAQGDFSVEQISIQTNLSIANASQHLQILKSAQLVDVSRQGNFVHYRLSNSNVFTVWKTLRDFGIERLASIEKLISDFRNSKVNVESVTTEDLVKKIKNGKVTVLDVRPETEYRKGHIRYAISIPFLDLSKRLNELPKRNEIITYCRGPFCVYADEAVAILTKAGYKAKRLDQGYPDWVAMGLPIESNQ